MKRKDALNLLKFAGYHGDNATFTRVLIEERVSRASAQEAYLTGARARRNGVACGCNDCKAKTSEVAS